MTRLQWFPAVSTLGLALPSVWNTFQTSIRQRWMLQINMTESNAVILSSCLLYAFVFPTKYRLLCYIWDYINAAHNTAVSHVHTLTICYETLDGPALKSLLESAALSRPRARRWMDTRVIKGIPLCSPVPGGCFPLQLLVWMWEILWCSFGLTWKWQAALLAFLRGERCALPVAGRLIGFCLREDCGTDWDVLALTSSLISNHGTYVETFSSQTVSGEEI